MKMTNAALCVVAFLICVSSVVAQNACDGVLQFTGRNVISQSTDRDRRSFVYQRACSGRYRSSTGSARLEIDSVIKAVPVGIDLGLANNEEKVDTWCSNNTDVQLERDRAFSFGSLVYEPAITAWESCVKANTDQLRIEPTLIDDSAPIFKVTNLIPGGQVVELRGITISDKSTSCQIFAQDQTERANSGTEMKRVLINGGMIANISCFRTPEKKTIEGTEVAVLPEVSISILTSVKDYQIKLPIKRAFLVTENRMAEILTRLTKLEENQLKVGNGCMRINKTQLCWGTKELGPVPGAVHTANFSFTYDQPFASPPNITTGINVNDTGRFLAVFNSSISKTGYSGVLTHQGPGRDQVPAGIIMSYVAIGNAVD